MWRGLFSFVSFEFGCGVVLITVACVLLLVSVFVIAFDVFDVVVVVLWFGVFCYLCFVFVDLCCGAVLICVVCVFLLVFGFLLLLLLLCSYVVVLWFGLFLFCVQ